MEEHEPNGDTKGESKHSSDSADISDEGDSFEDAQGSGLQSPEHHGSPAPSTRSLTNRGPSSTFKSSTTPHATYLEEHKHTVEPGHNEKTRHQKSPLLTSHRLSTSSLDDVNLEEAGSDVEPKTKAGTISSNGSEQQPHQPPKSPQKTVKGSASRLQNLSSSLPSVPWGAPPAPPLVNSNMGPPPNPLPTRKLTSPFSWLSRNTTKETKETKEAVSPTLQPVQQTPTAHRDTTSSLATIGSNPELMLSRIEDGNEPESPSQTSRRPGRNSLRDRFKMLRLREEAGITSLDVCDAESSGKSSRGFTGLIGRSTSPGVGAGSPTSTADERDGGVAGSPIGTVDQNLAPGTASGVSAGPSSLADPAAPVDWDLWQSVVYEGPAAVARSSPEELNRTIISGIPSAIRGVVWQVLAQSKNEELEGVYKDLLLRGTDKERDRTSTSSTSTTTGSAGKGEGVNGHANSSKEKDSVKSSASSIHSENSAVPAPSTNGINSPTLSHDKDPETIAKIQAQLLAEKKKKAKEEAAALQKLEKAIKRDLGARTSFSKYAVSAGLQDGLFGVCKAYALFDEGVGYAQGMNFLAMPLLFNMPEEEAFCMLVRLMNQYKLREMFIQDMPGLHLHLYQFERLLEDLEPALYCHLHRRGVTPQLYATQWFLTLFAYRFPLQLVLRIYDLVLSEGLEGAILKFGVVLMQKNAETLLGMNDMSTLTTFLKERLFDVYIDQAPTANSILESGFFGSSSHGIEKEVYRADVLVQDACLVKLTPAMLQTYTSEWEEKTRMEAVRETELEHLKSANAALTAKVRLLEERAEKHDSEHVQVASELVRTKVENEELKDENESLKGQVEELRKVVEKQPEEVEGRLKGEIDRLMKRNLEVHDENQSLEEQLSNMEKDLVEAKMARAEINSNYEDLKRKWNDMRKVLGD